MENGPEPSVSSCNGSQDIAREEQENTTIPVEEENTTIPVEQENTTIPVVGRIKRQGFSDTLSSNDIVSELRSLNAEQEEEGQKEGDEESLPRGDNNSNSLESETASRASTSGSEGQLNPLVATHWRDFFRGLKKGAARRIQALSPPKKHGPKLTRSKTKRIREELIPVISSPLDADLYCLKSSWQNFSLSEIKTATNNCSHEGGYAEVYKGQLQEGQLVAIKRLTRGSPEEMTVDFLSELGIMVHVDHPNIAKVIGYGVEGGMHLVLQLSAHGSLASILYGPKEKLDWPIRHKIAAGTADGLQYLHEGCQRRIIHKDISDFGLAKWLPEHWTHHTVSKVEGTFGYLPPEFFMHGIVDEKIDVYAYGVLLLELITGKQAIDCSQQSLVMWAKPLLVKDRIKELVDPTLADAYDEEQMEILALTASFCIYQSSMQRPHMNQIVEILKGNKDILEEVKDLQNSIHQRTYSEELFDADEYNSTKYLKDINRQMEIVNVISPRLQKKCKDKLKT
ncbi:hypothetical protein P3X46_006040 [Hevea brasiliensis]|uniref:Protein kinase domain-containing protein n=1 Tax=Hevea brasiliensis TaxID=3981 RepID=A0ABQ9MNZ7_HEVBR|nr:hypothetical protein P3X46_006040 [Hevea brasiliensis]